jgi:hypothetical protein
MTQALYAHMNNFFKKRYIPTKVENGQQWLTPAMLATQETEKKTKKTKSKSKSPIGYLISNSSSYVNKQMAYIFLSSRLIKYKYKKIFQIDLKKY